MNGQDAMLRGGRGLRLADPINNRAGGRTDTQRGTAAKHKEHTQMPQDTPIEFQNNCLFQANAVELSNGVIVFDSCGRCESCARHSLTDGVAARDEAKAFRMASQEEIMRQQTAIETWTNWPWS